MNKGNIKEIGKASLGEGRHLMNGPFNSEKSEETLGKGSAKRRHFVNGDTW